MADETVVTPAPTEPTPVVANTIAPTDDTSRAEIDALAQSFGYDPTAFAGVKDIEAAKVAIKLAVETSASRSYIAPEPVNLPANRFSQPTAQSEPESFKPIDYKSLGLDEDDAAAKVLRLQEAQLRATNEQVAAMKARLDEQQKQQKVQSEQVLMQQVDEVVSGFASPRYGTSTHRTNIQQAALDHLIGMAATIRRNSGGSLPIKACLNQARLLDEGTTTAMSTVLPEKKAANSVLTQGSAPSLGGGEKPMRMIDQWSQRPEIRAKLGLDPRPQVS